MQSTCGGALRTRAGRASSQHHRSLLAKTKRHTNTPTPPRAIAQQPAGARSPASASLPQLLEWARARGATLDRVAVERDVLTGEELLVAARDAAPGDVLLSLPEQPQQPQQQNAALWLTPAAARAALLSNATDPAAAAAAVDALEPWLLLAVFLIAERARLLSAGGGGGASSSSSTSPFAAYVASLPEELDTPLAWSEAELAELEGTQVLATALSYRAFFDQRFEQLLSSPEAAALASSGCLPPGSTLSLDALRWAASTVRARTRGDLSGDRIALIPLADAVPHRRAPSAVLKVKERRAGGLLGGLLGGGANNNNAANPRVLSIEATRPLRKGDAVTVDYGPTKTEGAVLLESGAMDASAEAEAAGPTLPGYRLSLSIPASDRWADDKRGVLERAGLLPDWSDASASVEFLLARGGGAVSAADAAEFASRGGAAGLAALAAREGRDPLPEEMLGVLRLVHLSGGDCFLLEAVFENEVWGHVRLPISPANEEAVCAAAADGARDALAAHPGGGASLADDLAELRALRGAGGAGSSSSSSGSSERAARRRALALRARVAEKEALEALLSLLEQRRASLETLEYYQERRLKRLGLVKEDGSTTYDGFFKDSIA
jgi:[ribulose-bisphosphate carboxylase]/[fructose-bisphosphate aldolase]-lysine N-methyltransferase